MATSALVLAILTGACASAGTPAPGACHAPAASASQAGAGDAAAEEADLVVLGRIMTMDDPPTAEAVLIEGGVVTCLGSREDVLERAGDHVPVVDIGSNVGYPGFIDAHAHWIGDRDRSGIGSPAEAVRAALSRGWTSISEQWVDPGRLDELAALADGGALPIRVDAYLALNFGRDFLGDWYADREPGSVGDRLRVRGVKIHLDDGMGDVVDWEQHELTEAITRADAAGCQVSVHSVSTEAQAMLLDAPTRRPRPDRAEPAPPPGRPRQEVVDEMRPSCSRATSPRVEARLKLASAPSAHTV